MRNRWGKKRISKIQWAVHIRALHGGRLQHAPIWLDLHWAYAQYFTERLLQGVGLKHATAPQNICAFNNSVQHCKMSQDFHNCSIDTLCSWTHAGALFERWRCGTPFRLRYWARAGLRGDTWSQECAGSRRVLNPEHLARHTEEHLDWERPPTGQQISARQVPGWREKESEADRQIFHWDCAYGAGERRHYQRMDNRSQCYSWVVAVVNANPWQKPTWWRQCISEGPKGFSVIHPSP